MKDIWKTLVNIIGPLFKIISENYGFILGMALAGTILFGLWQWQQNKDLKENIIIIEETAKNDARRLLNNINSLNDSLNTIESTNIKFRQIVSVKENEIQYLNSELISVKTQFSKYIDTVIDTVYHIENIIISDFSIQKDSSDVDLVIDSIGVDTFRFTILDSNIVYSHLTTFNIFSVLDSINNSNLIVENLNRKFDFNVRMSLAQTVTGSGAMRVFLNITDKDGKNIPSDLFQIPFLTGANYIDTNKEPPIIIVQTPERKNFTVTVGPTFGMFNREGLFSYSFGLGVTLGYKLWEF